MTTARPPIERMALIYALLLRNMRVTCSTLARHLEVDVKTVQRDIDFMRNRLGLPLDYEPGEFTWRINDTARLPWWLHRPGDKNFRTL
jgi:predicted DNA-binding transcriptional regulator YafY